MGDEIDMRRPTTWLLVGSALAGGVLAVTAGAAFASEQAARREAAEDAAPAARIERRAGDRHIHVYDGRNRMDRLSEMLQLRPDQQPALKTLLDITSRRTPHERLTPFDGDDDRTTTQRLDAMQAKMAQQQAEADRRIAAIKTFYAQLDASQKKAFDGLPMLMVVGPTMGPMMMPQAAPMAAAMPAPPRPPKPPKPPAL